MRIASETFFQDPYSTIRSLLGEGIKITKYEVLSVITTNSRILVDVEYEALIANSLITYYVKLTDLTSCTPDHNNYTFKTPDGTNIWVDIDDPESINSNYLMLTLIPFDSKEVEEGEIAKRSFRYFGSIVDQPLHAYSTIFDGNRYMHSDIDVEELLKSDLAKVKRKELYTMEETESAYLSEVQRFEHLSHITDVKRIEDIEKIDSSIPSNIGFLIESSKLPKGKIIQGVIVIQPVRVSNIVFFYPHMPLYITPEQFEFVCNLIEIDRSINLFPVEDEEKK